MSAQWKTYEEVTTYLLGEIAHELGLERVEGKQTITGARSGTEWEVDAKGIRSDQEGFVIIECRRYTTAGQSQEKVGALAYRIMDTGAAGGIVVSPIGLQSGAAKVASAEGIIHVHLGKDSTKHQYFSAILEQTIRWHSRASSCHGINVRCSPSHMRFMRPALRGTGQRTHLRKLCQ